MAYKGGELDQWIWARWLPQEHLLTRPVPTLAEVPAGCLRPAVDVSFGAAGHPRRIAYELDAVTRSRLLHLRRPAWTASVWSAAAMWGLEYFVDSADTCALTSGVTRPATGPDEVSRRRLTRQLREIPPMRPDRYHPYLQVTPPVLTLVHCLQSVLSGGHSWLVLPGTGLTDTGVRAVQLVDALCRIFRIDPAVLPDVCGHHIDRNVLRSVVGDCDRGADSPPETLMRLMVREVAGPLTTQEFRTQVVVHADGSISDPVHGGPAGAGRIVARLDLGCPALRLAIQYDGSGHLDRSRRDRDSRITTELTNLGWHVLRITWGHLKDPALFLATVADAIRLCERRLAGP
ncbi:endonuclease domain-containing protein [Corynebacterium sp. AOP40-9SA-29]|uniref:endonuclease domain-containing protein n=1 Tax=Corynebacterium sp. AOP40-9SA-29 TaxID=3457677 RepID=UPI0040341872